MKTIARTVLAGGLSISYLREDSPLGTAGSLSLIDKSISGPLVVTNGDIVLSSGYAEVLATHRSSGVLATMAVLRRNVVNPFGVVSLMGNHVQSIEEKPQQETIVSAGVNVIDTSVLHLLNPQVPTDMPQLLQEVINGGGKVAFHEVSGSWWDIGTEADLRLASSALEG